MVNRLNGGCRLVGDSDTAGTVAASNGNGADVGDGVRAVGCTISFSNGSSCDESPREELRTAQGKRETHQR